MTTADEGAFHRLVASINPAWIEQALEAMGTATVRTRRLPAEQVIWLVLGMALYAIGPSTSWWSGSTWRCLGSTRRNRQPAAQLRRRVLALVTSR